MKAWRTEIITAVLLILTTIILGSFTGWFFPILFLLTLMVLMRQTIEINRLERWLKSGGVAKYPKSQGIWEEIYYHIYRIKKSDKRRKKRLGKMLEQFRRSTAALPDAAVVLGDQDVIEWSNKAAREVLGLRKEDRGQRIPNLIRQPDFARYLKARDDNATITMTSPVNNNIILEFRVVSYGADLRLLLAHDVTQVNQIERMRKDFVANVSHELRTPLTVLIGYLETLRDMDDGHSGLLTNSVGPMITQTERMQHLVDDLLLLARLETQQKQSHCVEVPQLLNEICREGDVLGNAAQRIKLFLETDARIDGDEQELRSAFTNILVNALKYSPDDTIVKVNWRKTDNAIQLDVEDQGEGIDALHIPRITERFYRVDVQRSRKLSGTGLGLAIVKHVLVRHEAELKITSELGKGSHFSCVFPLKRIC